jgi:hypothetical protein
MKTTLLLICFFLVAANRVVAQKPVMTVESNPSACEVNAAAFDNLANDLRSNNEHIFIIARLGNGEWSRAVNRRRLSNVRTYFVTNWKIDPARFTFAVGSRVDGEGRVEFYIGSTLWLISYVKPGRDICVDCCDYPDRRYYGMGKRDHPRRRAR